MGKKYSIDLHFNEQNFRINEAQKLFNLKIKSLDILIHPDSGACYSSIKNGLTKFIYHDTSMIIPLANTILMDL